MAQAVRLTLIRPESLKGAEVRRQTADDDITRIDENTGNQIERLLGSGRDLDMIDRNVQVLLPFVEFGNLLTEGKDTFRRTILQCGIPLLIQYFLDNLLQLFQRKSVRVGEATGK